MLRQSEIPLKGVSEIVSPTDPSLQSWRENAHRLEVCQSPARGSGRSKRVVQNLDPGAHAVEAGTAASSSRDSAVVWRIRGSPPATDRRTSGGNRGTP